MSNQIRDEAVRIVMADRSRQAKAELIVATVLDPQLARIAALEARLAQFGIPLTGDPDKTFCEVCKAHFRDLTLHDYERHGLRAHAETAPSEPQECICDGGA